jgi:mRNA-degrading endonuclease HigB of HigAB toxin-antitoxin module
MGKQHAEVADELNLWFAIANCAAWKDLAEVRANFANADQVGRILIFNIRRNVYRLIVKVDFRSKLVMVKELSRTRNTKEAAGKNGVDGR